MCLQRLSNCGSLRFAKQQKLFPSSLRYGGEHLEHLKQREANRNSNHHLVPDPKTMMLLVVKQRKILKNNLIIVIKLYSEKLQRVCDASNCPGLAQPDAVLLPDNAVGRSTK